MKRVADYIAEFLAEKQVRHVFMISGGGAMHLNDAFGRNQAITYLCNHHEQASAIAAEGYARLSGKLAVVCVTTGPGGLNTLTGVMGQWTDSIPVLYISGQVKFETTLGSCPDLPLRQLGDQEVDIIRIVRPLTKFSVSVRHPQDIRKILEEAVYWAMNGRRGPVWIDVPMNIQSAMIDEKSLEPFIVPRQDPSLQKPSWVNEVVGLLKRAKRPLIIAGHGIRLAGASLELFSLLEKCAFPVVTTHNGRDLVPDGHPLFIGKIGTLGDRAGNFALQGADLILSVGSRNNVRQVSYNWANFARQAKIISVDIDPAELKKPLRMVDVPVCMDAKEFLVSLRAALANEPQQRPEWLNWCRTRRERYPVVLPEYGDCKNINPYYFVKTLTECLPEGEVVVAGNGSASVCLFQAATVKAGQRLLYNSGCAAMGYDLPAAIGACLASDRRRVICLAGDGSLSMNLQELQTIFHHQLPIKLFVLDNNGYSSIQQTQDAFFGGKRVACDRESGVTFPDFCRVAEAFGIPASRLADPAEMREHIDGLLSVPGPCLCVVKLAENYHFSPKVSSQRMPDGTMVSKSFEDMFPFLPPSEVLMNKID